MNWLEFMQQTGVIIGAAQTDIRESEASFHHNEGCKMGENLGDLSRKQARLQRTKLHNQYLSLRERREILLTAPETTPGREDGLRNLDKLIKALKAQLRVI